MIGTTLAHYRITAKLGAGGMGEVYLGRDTRLDREVAIKVLPEQFARDPERLARFEREAKVLASLNHPGIAAIYGFEQAGGVPFLALEYVPGETLAEVIARGPIAAEEALGVAARIGEALEAAHARGVVHRDLKPANIKITPGGKVKVLDFGLAKALGDEPPSAAAGVADAPTKTAAATRAGAILGTAAYMSPEQARGKPVDQQADIWAFGCVLYEMLSGRRAFAGESFSDSLAAILRAEPDAGAIPAGTPASIRSLLRRCLAKEPERRLHHIADARLELEEAVGALSGPVTGASPPPTRPAPWRRAGGWLPIALMAVFAGVAVWSLFRAPRQAPRPPVRATVALPPKATVALGRGSSLVISPDGQRVAYVAASDGRTLIYLRPLDRLESVPVSGTEGGSNPFFSPDGQWIGFFADRKLKKVSLRGGAPVTLGDAPNARGETWGPDDTIVFTPRGNAGLSRISAAGGAPQQITTLGQGELSHRWPQVLPGGKAVLFTIWNDTGFENARIVVQSLETGRRSILLHGGGYARYAADSANAGYLVYARTEGLLAAPFDPRRLEVTGPSFPVLESVITNLSGGAHFSLSADGSLVYLPGTMGEADRTLVWVDRRGAAEPMAEIRALGFFFRLSPDGRRLGRHNTNGPNRDIWIYDLERKGSTRLTFGGNNIYSVWTPDGKRVTFTSGLPVTNLFWKAADGSGPEEWLTTSPHNQLPDCWSPDGKMLVYTEFSPTRESDLWILPLEGDRKPRPFLNTPFSESDAAVSPDGRWLAYQSNESGRFEIHVQPFPGGGRKWQVSTDGGFLPLWARDARELFFRRGDAMMASGVNTAGEFSSQTPRMLFEGRYDGGYDISRDGRRFLMMKGTEQESAPTQWTLVLNWLEEVKRRAPTASK